LLKTPKKQLIKLIIAGFITPLILFAGTTSQYALSFIFSGDVTEVGLRSGDSITQIDDITFHGDYTLIALHFYLLENPDSAFSKVFGALSLDDKVESLWNEKLQAGLISESKQVGKDTSSLNGHILKPGLITEPWTMLWPAFVFLAGPFPFIGEPGQTIILTNTFFNPTTVEIEMVEHDASTLAHALYGDQTKAIAPGIYTIYDKDKNIYKQYNLYEIKDQFNETLYEVREERTSVDETLNLDNITG
jgi:hypothetical protein